MVALISNYTIPESICCKALKVLFLLNPTFIFFHHQFSHIYGLVWPTCLLFLSSLLSMSHPTSPPLLQLSSSPTVLFTNILPFFELYPLILLPASHNISPSSTLLFTFSMGRESLKTPWSGFACKHEAWNTTPKIIQYIHRNRLMCSAQYQSCNLINKGRSP